VRYSVVFLFTIYKCKELDILNYDSAQFFVWVGKLVPDIEGVTQGDGIRQERVWDIIWVLKG
jgi:hypothetical protein